MPKGRMLNKKISYDPRVGELSIHATLIFTWIIPHLDCEGRIYADPNVIKGVVVPYKKTLTMVVIQKALEELHASGLVRIYGDDYKYLQCNGFFLNQTINKSREAPSEIPSEADLLQSKSGVTPGEVKLSKDKISKDLTPEEVQRTVKVKHLDFVLLTAFEHTKLRESLGISKAKDMMQRLNDYIGSKGVNYKSHYHTILSWVRKDGGDTSVTSGYREEDEL